MTVTRLQLRYSGAVAVLGGILGLSPQSSFVEVDEYELRVKMGFLARGSVPRSHIKDAQPMEWSSWAGRGVRWYGPRRWGLIGSTQGVVELVLEPPTRMRMILPVRAKRLALSLEEPDRLLELLGCAH
jgi:hypothetical protein